MPHTQEPRPGVARREAALPADREDARRATTLTVTAYLMLTVFVLTEKFGQTTSDTRLDLTNAPARFLRDTFTLWNSQVSLGELQNQAYGYLWPQGPFYSGLIELGVPGWLTERLWSALVLVVACEGLRRVALALGLNVWAAALAGLAYGLSPRMVAELGVRSAEILPGAVLPWALLPLVLAVTGRLTPWRAAVLSAAAFTFSGGVNGTATFAPAVLLIIVVAWAVLSRRLGWRFGLGWAGLMVAVNAWWALAAGPVRCLQPTVLRLRRGRTDDHRDGRVRPTGCAARATGSTTSSSAVGTGGRPATTCPSTRGWCWRAGSSPPRGCSA